METVFFLDDLAKLRAFPEPGEVTPRQLARYLDRIRAGETSCSPRPTRGRALGAIGASIAVFFEVLVTERLIEENPARTLTQPRRPRRR